MKRQTDMAVSYDYYRVFYYAARTGSFTKAAGMLLSNQPNVTRTIGNLEAELGCRLFTRSRSGVTLTPEGEKLYAHVEAAFRHLEQGEVEIAKATALETGHLCLSVSEIALHAFLLPVLQRFQSEYPGVRLELLNHTTTQGISAVRSGRADLAIVTLPKDTDTCLAQLPLADFQDILIAGPRFRHLLNHPLTPRELSHLPFICLGKDTQSYAFFSGLFAAQGASFLPSVEAATADQIVPLVRCGLGLGFVPETFALEALRDGSCLQLSLAVPVPARQICMLHDPQQSLSRAASAFLALSRQSALPDTRAN